MSKLAKFKHLNALAKEHAKKHSVTRELAGDGIELASMTTLGVATRSVPNGIANVKFLKFDWIGGVLAGVGWGISAALKKGKWAWGFRHMFKGALFAIFARWLGMVQITAVAGPDGTMRFV